MFITFLYGCKDVVQVSKYGLSFKIPFFTFFIAHYSKHTSPQQTPNLRCHVIHIRCTKGVRKVWGLFKSLILSLRKHKNSCLPKQDTKQLKEWSLKFYCCQRHEWSSVVQLQKCKLCKNCRVAFILKCVMTETLCWRVEMSSARPAEVCFCLFSRGSFVWVKCLPCQQTEWLSPVTCFL